MFLKKIILVVLLVGFFIAPVSVFAQNDYGLGTTAGAAGLADYGTNLPGMIGSVLGTALSLVGVLFFALMLYGGVVWMTARGNAEDEKKALGTITAAIIGILIVLGSYAITNFVFSSLKGGSGSTASSVDSGKADEDKVAHDKEIFLSYWETSCGQLSSEECQKNSFCQVLTPPKDGLQCSANESIPQEQVDSFCLSDEAIKMEDYDDFCVQIVDLSN